MKILKGRLKETLYTWPDKIQLNNGEPSPPQVERETVYNENEVTYMSDKLGLHKVSNPDPENFAVSLHRKYPNMMRTLVHNMGQFIRRQTPPYMVATSLTN